MRKEEKAKASLVGRIAADTGARGVATGQLPPVRAPCAALQVIWPPLAAIDFAARGREFSQATAAGPQVVRPRSARCCAALGGTTDCVCVCVSGGGPTAMKLVDGGAQGEGVRRIAQEEPLLPWTALLCIVYAIPTSFATLFAIMLAEVGPRRRPQGLGGRGPARLRASSFDAPRTPALLCSSPIARLRSAGAAVTMDCVERASYELRHEDPLAFSIGVRQVSAHLHAPALGVERLSPGRTEQHSF